MKSRILSVDKAGSSGLGWGLGSLAAVALAGAISYSYFYEPSIEPPAVVLSPRTATPQVMAYPTQGPDTDAATQAPATTVAARKPASLADKVDSLVASGKPEDAFVAYETVARCLMARGTPGVFLTKEENIAFSAEKLTPEAACGDISPGQVTSRMQWLETAAKANVPNAAWAFLSAGPRGFGGLADSTPADWDETNPVTAEWLTRLREYIKTAADTRAEPMPVWNMSDYAEHTGDKQSALKYYVAAADLQRLDSLRTASPEWVRTNESIMRRLSKGLSQEAVSQAIAEGHKLAKLGGAK